VKKNHIPIVVVIQEWVEKCWGMGFDIEGAQHFGGNLVKTRGKIGTNDVAALFRSFGVKMDVIDFMSKRLPDDMIKAQEIALRGTSQVPQQYETNMEMIYWISNYFATGKQNKFCPPLYLQHEGHSRTIVGTVVDKKMDEINIIIFDPAHIGPQLKSALQNKAGMNYVVKSAQHFSHEKYQIGYITSNEIVGPGNDFQKLKKMDFVAESNSNQYF